MLPLKVIVAVPAYGRKVDASHIPMWIKFGMACEKQKTSVDFQGAAIMDECNLARVRNALVEHALAQNADWLLTVDADTAVEIPENLLDMIYEGQNRDAAVIAAPVRHRAVDAWNVQDYDWKAVQKSQFENRVARVGSIGAACMAINMVFLATRWPTPNPMPWFAFQHLKDNNWMGEDLAFCTEVRKRGGDVYCDGRVKTLHRTHGEYLK